MKTNAILEHNKNGKFIFTNSILEATPHFLIRILTNTISEHESKRRNFIFYPFVYSQMQF